MRGLLKSFVYAFRGIAYNLSSERNFRIHCCAAVTMLLLSLFYDFSSAEYGLLILQICVVISVESLNTAVEQTDNKITREKSVHIRRAKDSAAAAVLVTAIGAVAVAFFLFWDPAVFAKIAAYFSVWYRLVWLGVYVALMIFFVFCKKTYKKGMK